MSMYNISVIPQNLRREETVIQIAESLNYLSDVTHDIFKKINNRLEENDRNLNSIQERISKVNKKISNLSTAKNAIQVFSSSKYPASEINTTYNTIFDPKDHPTKTKFPIEYKEQQSKDEPLEKLQFFHFTSNNIEKIKSEGLGDIPQDINSVNDFLLFNSGKNPYSEYVISDNLRILRAPKKHNDFENHEIGAAPLSISERIALTKAPSENYFYSPDLGDVPSIDVPIDLPDLPGIADDLRYTDETGPGIAPSVTTTPNVPNLPQFVVEQKKPKIEVIEETVVIEKISPPPPEIKIVEKPPPPIQVEPIKIEEKPKEVIKEKETKKPETGNAHANLMDEIRKAGGLKNAKLRSTDQREPQIKESSGGDLVADFHAKLSLRRKGISGTKKTNEWDAGSVMQRVLETMIPPPTKSEQSESATTDEEWN